MMKCLSGIERVGAMWRGEVGSASSPNPPLKTVPRSYKRLPRVQLQHGPHHQVIRYRNVSCQYRFLPWFPEKGQVRLLTTDHSRSVRWQSIDMA
jgi:hypothetical protein